MVVAWTYAVAVNFVPAYTLTVDKLGESTVGLESEGSQDEEANVKSSSVDEKQLAVHVER